MIEGYAFNQCTNLSSGELVPGVKEVNNWGFCEANIINLKIPGSVIIIGNSAFREANAQTLTLPEGLEVIEESALYDNQITLACVPSSVTIIGSCILILQSKILSQTGEGTFSLTDLKNITIPKSVESIGSESFSSTPISSIEFEEGSALRSVGDYVFSDTNLTSIVFPPSVKTLGVGMFEDTHITHIKFPGTAEFCYEFLDGIETKCTVCFYNCKKAPYVRHNGNITIETREDNPFTK